MSGPLEQSDNLHARGDSGTGGEVRAGEPDISEKEREEIDAQIEEAVAHARAPLGPEGLAYKSERSGAALPLIVNAAAVLVIVAWHPRVILVFQQERAVADGPACRPAHGRRPDRRDHQTGIRAETRRQGSGNFAHPGTALRHRRTTADAEGGQRGPHPAAGGGASRDARQRAGGRAGEAAEGGSFNGLHRQAGASHRGEEEQGARDRACRVPSAGRPRACREGNRDQQAVHAVLGQPRGCEGREGAPGVRDRPAARTAARQDTGGHRRTDRGTGKPPRADPSGTARGGTDRELIRGRRPGHEEGQLG